MRLNRIYRALSSALLVSLLSACATQEKASGPLLDPQTFIDEKRAVVERTAKVGPQIRQAEKKKPRERVLINQEEPRSYLDLDQSRDEIFPVSFEFHKVSIKVFAESFAKLIGMNVLVGDEVEGGITATLENVPWNRALDHILEMHGLAKHVDHDSKIVRIHKREKLTELEGYQRQRAEEAARNLKAQRASLPMYTEMFRLFYTEPKDVKEKISEVLGIQEAQGAPTSSIYSTDPKITIDDRLNAIIVRATRDEIELVAQFIEKIDVATKQVLIEAFIVEAGDNFEQEFGARLDSAYDTDNYVTKDIGSSTTSFVQAMTAGGLLGAANGTLILTTAELRAHLTAMQDDGLTRIISNPKVFVLDNEKASIGQGKQVPYSTVSDSGTKTEFVEALTELEVTPSIVGDGNVILEVKVSKDSPDESSANADAPPINTNSVETRLIVPDKAIAVIGGIIIESESSGESKVPGLGDLDGVGNLFKKTTNDKKRSELLIFLAPRVL